MKYYVGKKLYLNCKDVSVIKVPQYNGLHVKDILKFDRSKVDIKMYIPYYAYKKEPNREKPWNIINTLAKDEFKEYIDEKVESRKLELINYQNLGVRAKPEFIHLFEHSQSVSTMKGNPIFLLDDQKQVKIKSRSKF